MSAPRRGKRPRAARTVSSSTTSAFIPDWSATMRSKYALIADTILGPLPPVPAPALPAAAPLAMVRAEVVVVGWWRLRFLPASAPRSGPAPATQPW